MGGRTGQAVGRENGCDGRVRIVWRDLHTIYRVCATIYLLLNTIFLLLAISGYPSSNYYLSIDTTSG